MKYTIARKAGIIESVRSGKRLLPDVLNEYDMSIEEWMEWCRKYDASGLNGLRVACPSARFAQAKMLNTKREEVNRRQREKYHDRNV